MQTVAATHAPDYGRGDAFGIRHRFVGRSIVGSSYLWMPWNVLRQERGNITLPLAFLVVMERPRLNVYARDSR